MRESSGFEGFHENLFDRFLSDLSLFFDDKLFDEIVEASFVVGRYLYLDLVDFISEGKGVVLKCYFECYIPSFKVEDFIPFSKRKLKKIVYPLASLLLNIFVEMGNKIILNSAEFFKGKSFIHTLSRNKRLLYFYTKLKKKQV